MIRCIPALGYSLRDWNLRVILHRIWGELKLGYKSWAVQLNPQEIDQKFWRNRDVDILNIRLEDIASCRTSGSRSLLPNPRSLRTGHKSFPSLGSSRLTCYSFHLLMPLVMTCSMKPYEIIYPVCSFFFDWSDVVDVYRFSVENRFPTHQAFPILPFSNLVEF